MSIPTAIHPIGKPRVFLQRIDNWGRTFPKVSFNPIFKASPPMQAIAYHLFVFAVGLTLKEIADQ